MPPRKGDATSTTPTTAKVVKTVPDRRAPQPSEKDLWVTIGKMQSDHDHLADRVTLAESNIAVLTAQGAATDARLASIDHRLDGVDAALTVLPAIKASFDKAEARHEQAEEKAERRQRAVTRVVSKNQQYIGMLMGLVGASILQRNGAIPLQWLYGVGVVLVVMLVVIAARTYWANNAPQGGTP